MPNRQLNHSTATDQYNSCPAPATAAIDLSYTEQRPLIDVKALLANDSKLDQLYEVSRKQSKLDQELVHEIVENGITASLPMQKLSSIALRKLKEVPENILRKNLQIVSQMINQDGLDFRYYYGWEDIVINSAQPLQLAMRALDKRFKPTHGGEIMYAGWVYQQNKSIFCYSLPNIINSGLITNSGDLRQFADLLHLARHQRHEVKVVFTTLATLKSNGNDFSMSDTVTQLRAYVDGRKSRGLNFFEALNECIRTEVVTDQTNFSRLLLLVENTPPERHEKLLREALPALKLAGSLEQEGALLQLLQIVEQTSVDDWGNFVPLIEPLVNCKTISQTSHIGKALSRTAKLCAANEADIRLVDETTRALNCDINEFVEHTEIPATVFLALKRIYGRQFKKLDFDWQRISSQLDYQRNFMRFACSRYPHKKELLEALQVAPTKELNNIIYWAATTSAIKSYSIGGILRQKLTALIPATIKSKQLIGTLGSSKDRAVFVKKLQTEVSKTIAQDLSIDRDVSTWTAKMATCTAKYGPLLVEVLTSLASFMPAEQKQVLRQAINSLLDQQWPDWRYENNFSKNQLKFLNQQQKQAWRDNDSKQVTIVQDAIKAKIEQLKGILGNAEEHIKICIPEFEASIEYLKNLTDQITELERDKKKGKAYARVAAQKKIVSAFLFLQENSLESSLSLSQITKALKLIKTELNTLKVTEAQNDIANFEAEFSRKTQGLAGEYLIEETDDFLELLITGTIPQPTCMRWTEHTSQNKALPHILVDGNIKKLILRDQSGSVVGRMLFWCLKDTEGTVYIVPDSCHPTIGSFAKEFHKFLRDKADRMNSLRDDLGSTVKFPKSSEKGQNQIVLELPDSMNRNIYSDRIKIGYHATRGQLYL